MRVPGQPQSHIDGALGGHAASPLHDTAFRDCAPTTIRYLAAGGTSTEKPRSPPGCSSRQAQSHPLLFVASALAAGIVVDRYAGFGITPIGGSFRPTIWAALQATNRSPHVWKSWL